MKFATLIVVLSIVIASQNAVCLEGHYLSPSQKRALGMQIWQNEASQKYDLLVFWNQHESFPSLGICHFIWAPANGDISYTQTFPALLDYLKKHHVHLPSWLLKARQHGAPWKNREVFLQQEQGQQVKELKQLLFATIDLQVEFVIGRLYQAWHGINEHAAKNKKAAVAAHFKQMIKSAQGLYALIDYLNFKGAGTNPVEGYKGKGWGLLQVLETMPAKVQDSNIIAAFVASARKVLEERVANAPAAKAHEKKWLPGWLNRVNTYLTFNPAKA